MINLMKYKIIIMNKSLMNKYFHKLRNKKNIFLNYIIKQKRIRNNLIRKRYVTKNIKNQKIIGKNKKRN